MTTNIQAAPVDRRLLEIPPAPPELAEYCRRLEELVAERERELTAPGAVAEVDGEAIRMLGKDGSLEEMGLVEIDDGQLAANFWQIVALFREIFPHDPLALALDQAPVGEWFAKADHSPDRFFHQLTASLAAWAREHDLDEETLIQMLHWAAAPFRRRAVAHHREDLQQLVTNERGCCPVCSRTADLAELNAAEHGRRYLVCLPCELRWPYKRMGCPHCDNQNYDQLGYLLVDGYPAFRIYHCEQCKGYLKTIDRREDLPGPAQTLLAENIQTCFLDLLAVEQGYLPNP